MAPIPNLTLTSFMVMMLSCLLLSPGGLCSSSANVLYSDIDGGVLGTGKSLIYGGYRLTMRQDCNLVLSAPGRPVIWSSQSSYPGSKCDLTLTSTGELMINILDSSGSSTKSIWTGGMQSTPGSYALVLKFDGTINIYGPTLWSTDQETVGTWSGPPFINKASDSTLWTGQTATGTVIQDENYKLVLRKNCNLILSDVRSGQPLWSSDTVLASRSCFVTLQDDGELVIKNGPKILVWTSGVQGPPASDYVLALRPDGVLAVYGPSTWVRPESSEKMTGEKSWNNIATAIGK